MAYLRRLAIILLMLASEFPYSQGVEEQEEDQKQNLAPTCIALAILLVLVALCSNLIAFLLFYKKPVFRKILSNR